MREYPWLERRLQWSHVDRYRLIRAQAALAQAWVEALGAPQAYLLRKGVSPEFETGQSLLKSLEHDEPSPAAMGSRTPEEFLDLLSAAVRIRQALVLDQILKKDPLALDRLKALCFERGRLHAQRQPHQQQFSVRSAFLFLEQNSPGITGAGASFLVERATDRELRCVDLECPHRDPCVEVKAVKGPLCELQREWRAGFCSGLEFPGGTLHWSRLDPDSANGRCRFRLGTDP